MKYLLPFIILCVLSITACDKDDDPAFVFDPDMMHYDGANNTAPFFREGLTIVAAEFPPEVTSQYAGKKVEAVRLFIYDVPDAGALVLYSDGIGARPGAELANVDISGQLTEFSWNTIPLPTPVDIPEDGIWIGISVDHPGSLQVIGCDAGPRLTGGDWMYEESDNNWRTFQDRSGDSINWNIRAVIGE